MINFNVEPFYDDYDKHKHFYKILFRPSYSLQTRELTQMQSMVQQQVSRLGDHLFKNGTMVIPGELSLDNNFHYVKLVSTYGSTSVSTFISGLVGAIIAGGTTGVTAQVLAVAAATSTDPDTLFVKYLDGGTTGDEKTFGNNETLTPVDVNLVGLAVQTAQTASTGLGSSASIKEGVYYVEGHFVLCEPQIIVLDKYTNTPTYSVGFDVVESVTTPEDDESLLDNAQGSYNFSAPGAHRYSIELQLTKKTTLNDVNDTGNFIQIVYVLNGIAQNVYNQTQYAELAKVMARRTYDESGDYVVKDFIFNPREHRNNNRGAWVTGTAYELGDVVSKTGNYYEATSSATSGNSGAAWPTDELTEFDDGGVTWRFVSEPNYNFGVFTPEQGGDSDLVALAIEPGKAYVRGFEVDKVAATFMPIQKARTTRSESAGSISVLVGNYVLVTNIHAFPNLSIMPTVDLYSAMITTGGSPSTNGVKVGSARIRLFELHSGTVSASGVYKVGLFDVKLNAGIDFVRDVKSLYVNAGSTNNSFTADISPILVAQPGSVTMSVTGPTGTVTGTGTMFTSLKLEDVIKLNGLLHRVTVITSDSVIDVEASPDAPVTINAPGLSYSLATTTIYEPENSNLLFYVADYIKSMRNSINVNKVSYTTTQILSGTTNGSGVISFDIAADPNKNTWASPAILGNYVGTHGNGLIVNLTPTEVTLSNSDKTCTINFGGGVATTAVRIIATINKTGGIDTEKTKVKTYASMEVTTSAVGTAKKIILPVSDCLSVHSVKMKSGNFASPTGAYDIDITSKFMLDDGENDSYYGLSSIVLIDGHKAPTAPFKIIYSYNAHGTSGDYFTVNSYDSPYDKISEFNGTFKADCIDFRPRISNDGTSFDSSVAGASPASMPKRGYNIEFEYEYYMGRIDKMCIEPTGEFHLITGEAALIPAAPTSSSTGMLLTTMYVEPYTAIPKNINIVKTDNRRYTMRDIGKLEKRIENLEYYTTLSLSEMNTTNMDVTDSDGLTRYKNGFIVDSFNGHGVGNAAAADYRCAIDSANRQLRPLSVMKEVTLYEADTSNRITNHYTMTGDLITLPYTHTAILTQPFASRTENVNPFGVFSFVGMLGINPESDTWIDTQFAPDVITNVEGNYNALYAEYAGVLGSVYNSWQTVWTGIPYVTGSSTTETYGSRRVTISSYGG